MWHRKPRKQLGTTPTTGHPSAAKCSRAFVSTIHHFFAAQHDAAHNLGMSFRGEPLLEA
jgi:hypothetical protein